MDEFKDLELDRDRFKDNFKNLKDRIKKNKSRAEEDQAGYLNDMKFYKLAKDTEGEWHGSAAEGLLKQDVGNLKHLEMKPKKLQTTRDEYEEFELKVFRGHVHQEVRSRKESNYWLVKKRKKDKKKRAKLEGRRHVDDNDFYDHVLQFDTLEDWNMEMYSM